ncbi:putativetrehalose-phosphate synthase (udp-forming) [Phaeomoniella chlamydospora]|uniref:Putativetrehalose-phosphate synthase (Udp-forming) n=1 Tax=Phaeomoniella chlamydospora TaxID=158046 RepID=A0A0G2F4D1_PHACM|nr:putativetrehalose-phosphate synthase (udp-forming) [Phaeomoniella chlamydospora]
MTLPFSELISIRSISDSEYVSPALDKEWAIGSVPNGGYTSALFASAARFHSRTTAEADPKSPLNTQPDVLHLSLQFLRRTFVGHPGYFEVKNVKLGKRQTILHLTLTQPTTPDGRKSLVEGYASLGNLATEEGISLATSDSFWSPTPLPVDLKKLEKDGRDACWNAYTPPFLSFRRSSQHQQTYQPKNEIVGGTPEWKGIVDQWAKFTPYSDTDNKFPRSKWTNETIPWVVDNLPPIVEHMLFKEDAKYPKFWYPTLTLAIDVKKSLPPEGVDWLFSRCIAKVIKNGRMDLKVVVLDEQREIVAIATHTALAVDVARNVIRSNPTEETRRQGDDTKSNL